MSLRIAERRLIQIASGESEPTPNELVIIEEDYATREALEDYKLLFGDLEDLPAPQLSDEELDSILPGVKAKIQQQGFWQKLQFMLPDTSSLALRPVAAIAALFLFMIVPYLVLNSSGEIEDVSFDDFASLGYSTDEFLYDSGYTISMDDLVDDATEDAETISADSLELIYADTSIYGQAAELSPEDLAQLTAQLEAELNF